MRLSMVVGAAVVMSLGGGVASTSAAARAARGKGDKTAVVKQVLTGIGNQGCWG